MWSHIRVEYETDAPHARCDFSHKLKPFVSHRFDENRETSNVSAGPCQARNQTTADGVPQRRKHDWYSCGLSPHCFCDLVSTGHDNAWRHSDQFSRKAASFFWVATSPAIVDTDVAVFDPAQTLKFLPQRQYVAFSIAVAYGKTHYDGYVPH